MTDDEVRLVLPADPGYVRVARVAARGLGHRLGMPWSDIEDLALAVDEALVLLLRPDDPGESIAFTFTVHPDRLVVEAFPHAPGAPAGLEPARLARFEELVGPTVDVHEVDPATSRVHLEKLR